MVGIGDGDLLLCWFGYLLLRFLWVWLFSVGLMMIVGLWVYYVLVGVVLRVACCLVGVIVRRFWFDFVVVVR